MKFYKIILVIAIVVIAISSSAQTLDYTNLNYSSSLCNVFNATPLKVVGGSNHYPVSGGVSYNSSALVLQTKGGQTVGTTFGTAYAFAYTIKQGYKYSITVNASKQSIDQVSTPNLEIGAVSSLPNPNTTNPTACGSVNQNNWSVLQSAVIGTTFINSTTSQNYSLVQNFTANSNLSYFTVLAHSGSQTQNSTVLISAITIVETPPTGSFSISSSTQTLNCGSALPVTFSITNNNNTQGITGYTWNLGATPNGWLYNGNPAPSSIQIASSSLSDLTLTPDCGKALSNVSATITANGTSVNTTNSASISINQPVYSISGNSSLCSGSSIYTLNGLVCNSSFNWVAPPSNLGTLSSLTNAQTTFTYGGTSGNFALTANVTSCGITTPVTLPIRVGPYTASDYTMTGGNSSTQPLYWCPNQTYGFSVNGQGSNYQWSIPAGWTLNYQSNYLCVLKAPSSSYPPTGTVSVTFVEPCGTTITKSMFTAYSSSACTGTDPRFTYAPNPAPSYLNVAVASGYTSSTKIQRIQIISTTTGATVFDQNYGTPGILSTYITTSGFQTGTYSLRIFDGSIWATYQLSR